MQKRPIHRDRKYISGCQGLKGSGGSGVRTKRYGISFGGNKTPELVVVMDAQL